MGHVALVIYALASPKRTDRDGVVPRSALKPLGQASPNRILARSKT